MSVSFFTHFFILLADIYTGFEAGIGYDRRALINMQDVDHVKSDFEIRGGGESYTFKVPPSTMFFYLMEFFMGYKKRFHRLWLWGIEGCIERKFLPKEPYDIAEHSLGLKGLVFLGSATSKFEFFIGLGQTVSKFLTSWIAAGNRESNLVRFNCDGYYYEGGAILKFLPNFLLGMNIKQWQHVIWRLEYNFLISFPYSSVVHFTGVSYENGFKAYFFPEFLTMQHKFTIGFGIVF